MKMLSFNFLIQILIITVLQSLCLPEQLGYNGPQLGGHTFIHLDNYHGDCRYLESEMWV